MKETNTTYDPFQGTINGIAMVLSVGTERVTEGLRKATPEQLREVLDGGDAMFLLFEVDPEIVSEELRGRVADSILSLALVGRLPPPANLSVLADEIEASQAAQRFARAIQQDKAA